MKQDIDVLMVIEGEIATTQLIEQVLFAGKEHGIHYRKILLSELSLEDFKENTVPLFVRCGDPGLELWIDCLISANYPYLYYIDDNFWKIEGDSLIAHYYQHPLVRRSLELAVSNAYSLLTSSDVLAAFLRKFNKSTKILTPFFDFSLLEETTSSTSNEVRIGFAGSPSRADDLNILIDVIPSILDSYPNAIFEFAGVKPEGIAVSDRVRFYPHITDYNDFIKFKQTRQWSIGLAPLADTEANRCKTNNKYREYSACHIAGIYSDVAPYQDCVKPGINGLLVKNTSSDWRAAIKLLLDSPEKIQVIADNAYSDVRENYSVEHVASSWIEEIRKLHGSLYLTRSGTLRPAMTRMIIKRNFLRLESILVRLSAIYSQDGLLGLFRKLANRIKRSIRSTDQS
ncbi:glycosyltransferase [Pseudomonas sp. PDM15]|uniref:glycosyltransferase n=1 Tax=Pseudomonas sp. PDM15 TaxID=2769303 RepID=UPI00177AAACF|nr:glycosyltransferase [Pseudomonas sp. PDM15]MBD9427212.1 glycosyltransferase [Pseudomonas sp. PDM15]